MIYNALIIDSGAAEILAQSQFEDQWFNSFKIPESTSGLRRIDLGTELFLLSESADEDSPLLVVNLGESGIGETEGLTEVFQRILRVTLATFTHRVTIPATYKLFLQGSRFSIYARSFHKQSQERLLFNRMQADKNLYLYALTGGVDQLDSVDKRLPLYEKAREKYEDALISDPSEIRTDESAGAFGIVLNDVVGFDYSNQFSLKEWYESKLTSQQREFVDAPLTKPIRLRGSAGTGKTQSLAIKCLKELFAAEEESRDFRVAFITHSSGVAHEVVEGMFQALDPENRRENLSKSSLWLGSLYELAQMLLQYDNKQISPLSIDGAEGRKEQAEWVEICVEECQKDTYFSRSILPNCSDDVEESFQSRPPSDRFIREVCNEIACVLDAEGVKKHDKESTENYLNRKREHWQMKLPKESDRKAILEVHDRYRRYLAESNVINLDQMIGDLNGYLSSHEWSSYLKEQTGYDLILVDELHYFNINERMVFHNLVRDTAKSDGRLPLLMAYDLKQSTDDRFLSTTKGDAGRFFKYMKTGETELVKLTEVFRSTPQIAEFLESVDAAFPALDLEGEWTSYCGAGQQESGDVPELRVFDSDIKMIDKICFEAAKHARKIRGKNVAVLCMSEEKFLKYAKAGRIAKYISVVDSNTDLAEIRNARNRAVFSVPDNVAGLQFDRVYVLNVDALDFDSDENIGAKRRMLSKLYLACSRASRNLTIASSKEGGGPTKVLNPPKDRGLLKECPINT